jgi:hypothetical protein
MSDSAHGTHARVCNVLIVIAHTRTRYTRTHMLGMHCVFLSVFVGIRV